MARKVTPNVTREVDCQVTTHPVGAKRLKVVEVNLTGWEGDEPVGSQVMLADDLDEYRGAIVKPVIRYWQGDEDLAREALAVIVGSLAGVADHVHDPEYHVVKKRSARMPDLKPATPPLDAAKMYLEKRPPPKGMLADDVLAVLDEVLMEIPPPRPPVRPTRFIVDSWEGEGIMPFRDKQRLELGPGVFAVVGRNWSGKSAFVDTFPLGLFSQTGRGLQLGEYVHDEAEVATLSLGLSVEGESFDVRRVLDKEGTGEMVAGGVTGVTKAKAEVNRVLGIEYKDFVWTYFVGQDEVNGLLAEPSSSIKTTISKWLGLEFWGVAWDVLGKRVRTLEKELVAVRDRHARALERASKLGDDPTDDELEEVDEAYRAAVARVAKGEVDGEEIERLERELKRARRVAEMKDGVKGVKMASLESKAKRLGERSEKLLSKVAETRADFQIVSEDLAKVKQRLKKGFDGVCPVDGGDCPRVDEMNEDQSGVEAEKERMEALVVKKKAEGKKLRAESDGIKEELEGVEAELKRIEGARLLISDAKVDGLPTVTALERQVDDARKAAKAQPDGSEVESAENHRDRLRDARRRIEDAQAELDKVQKEEPVVLGKLRILRQARMVCSKTGVPSMQLDGAVLRFESSANEFLEKTGVPKRLEFSFEKEIDKPATACRLCGASFPKSARVKRCEECGEDRGKEVSDELGVLVRHGRRTQPLEADSGGGKTLVAVALRVALAIFFGAGVLFLDETCASLDDENLPKFVDMVKRLPEVGIEQVFVVTHREIASMFDCRIQVSAAPDGTHSTLEVA